ncbi:MAG: fumarylacetoacetate hydrolase family protein [Myxococcales bacterium]|nr:fumarylacetoacetate hydrolase family protein [Myxococcales bacterium]
MGFYIVRFSEGDSSEPLWGVERDERVLPLEVRSTTLRELIERGGIEAARARLDDPRDDGARSPEELTFWSPVTHPCQIVCQGKNYLEHLKETGTRPQDKTFNLLFSKASSTLNRPDGPVVRPAGVKLMDYECELGLVIGRRLGAPRRFTPETITEVVGGIVLANDVSARDVQVPQGQWYRGKSYRGFCPVGPRLYWLDPGDGPRIYQLALSLWVNDGLRQQATTQQMIYPPHETLGELSELCDLEIGDLVLTGTPGGVALQAPSPFVQRLSRITLSERDEKRLFVTLQARSGRYLHDGDRVRATIRSEDGQIDLGTQCWTVIAGDA